ncbi:ABC transporter substrate-binding protein [Aquabacter sp. CN5-332]|uniref:ABC transporter substrate-binding protein n=1 Tax=Aquabacter sp. CN5-332 TaxID=3156608 RepID=UPI0032B55E3E
MRNARSAMRGALAACALVLCAIVSLGAAQAEVQEVRIGRQPGLPFLPLMIMEHFKLVEKHAAAAGMPALKATYIVLAGPSQLNDAMLGGRLDMYGNGMPSLFTLWDRTVGTSREVKGLWSLQSMPLYLVTRNDAVKSVKDFTEKDKIAVPAVKVSVHAIVLQMAAAKEWGQANYARLDPLAINRAHPDATAALISNSGDISTHFASSPYYYYELDTPGIHKVLTSYEVLGRPHTNGAMLAMTSFVTANPKVVAIVRAAQEEANAFIKTNPRGAAEIYLAMNNDKSTVDAVTKMVADPEVEYTTVPAGAMDFATFMFKTGAIKHEPKAWTELFHATAADLPGN